MKTRRNADKLTLRVIAIAQGLLSLAALAMTGVLFNYGGAAASPIAFQVYLLFWIVGFVSAACLFTGALWARLVALVWNVSLLGAVIYLLASGPHTRAGRPLFIPPALVTVYLLVTSRRALAAAYRRSSNQNGMG